MEVDAMRKLVVHPWPETEHWSLDPVKHLCKILKRAYSDVSDDDIDYWTTIPYESLQKRNASVLEDIFVDAIVEAKNLVIFFDTIEDYTEPTTILRADVVDDKLRKLDYTVVHIPYFIQMSPETTEHYFGAAVDVECNARSGFYYKDESAPNEYVPARFCSLGWNKFIEQVYALPKSVYMEVMESLKAHSTVFGLELTSICFPLGLDCNTCPMHKPHEDIKQMWQASVCCTKAGPQ